LGWRGVAAGVLIGLFLFGGYAFQTAGLRYTTASKAGFITGLYVAMVPALSAMLLRQRPPTEAMLGVLLATIGLALLSLKADLSIERGDVLMLFCALSFALHIIAVGAFAGKLDAIALTLVQVATVTVISAAISLFGGQGIPTPSAATLGAAAFTGVLATAVAFGIQTAVQRFTTPTHTALIFTGEPVFAALFGVWLAGDLLTSANLVGGLLIILGTLITEVRWSLRTATILSRFLSPHYVAVPLILVMALYDSAPWQRALLWAGMMGVLGVALPLAVFFRQLRAGRISDWHVTDRRERLQPALILAALGAAVLPMVALLTLNGPRGLLVVSVAVLSLVVINLIITLWWKISQHVSSIAASATLITLALGVWASPVLLLIPLVAWARVKVGAHTILQTIAGGLTGATVAFVALRLFGVG
jgi:drug/metabolite transporter (DMT)-like permease